MIVSFVSCAFLLQFSFNSQRLGGGGGGKGGGIWTAIQSPSKTVTFTSEGTGVDEKSEFSLKYAHNVPPLCSTSHGPEMIVASTSRLIDLSAPNSSGLQSCCCLTVTPICGGPPSVTNPLCWCCCCWQGMNAPQKLLAVLGWCWWQTYCVVGMQE